MSKLIHTVYGINGAHPDPYKTTIGFDRLCIHIFHRGDRDPLWHDHAWSFWTFPLVSYVEEVQDPATLQVSHRVVRAFRFHYRPAETRHRILGRLIMVTRNHVVWAPYRRIITLVAKGSKQGAWGFYRVDGSFVPWRDYVFGGAQ